MGVTAISVILEECVKEEEKNKSGAQGNAVIFTYRKKMSERDEKQASEVRGEIGECGAQKLTEFQILSNQCYHCYIGERA